MSASVPSGNLTAVNIDLKGVAADWPCVMTTSQFELPQHLSVMIRESYDGQSWRGWLRPGFDINACYESVYFLLGRLRWCFEGQNSQNQRQFVVALNDYRFSNQLFNLTGLVISSSNAFKSARALRSRTQVRLSLMLISGSKTASAAAFTSTTNPYRSSTIAGKRIILSAFVCRSP